jgi:hypothetical protein
MRRECERRGVASAQERETTHLLARHMVLLRRGGGEGARGRWRCLAVRRALDHEWFKGPTVCFVCPDATAASKLWWRGRWRWRRRRRRSGGVDGGAKGAEGASAEEAHGGSEAWGADKGAFLARRVAEHRRMTRRAAVRRTDCDGIGGEARRCGRWRRREIDHGTEPAALAFAHRAVDGLLRSVAKRLTRSGRTVVDPARSARSCGDDRRRRSGRRRGDRSTAWRTEFAPARAARVC